MYFVHIAQERKSMDELLQATFRGESIDCIVNLVAKLLNNPIVLINKSFNILAYSKQLLSTDMTWLQATERGYITVEFAATLNNWEDINQGEAFLEVDEISQFKRRFYQLIYQGKLVGYLNILEEFTPYDKMNEKDILLIRQLLAKEVFLLQNRYSSSRHLETEEILMGLLDHQFIDRPHLLERLKNNPILLTQNFKVGCIDFTHAISYNAGKDEIQEGLRKILTQSVLLFWDKYLVILILEELPLKPLTQFLNQYQFTMGLSDAFTDIYLFTEHLDEAKAVLRLQYLIDDQKCIMTYEQCKIYHLFENIDDKQLIKYCHQDIIHLKLYDDKHNTDYVKTLFAYLTCLKSLHETAQMLYVHRNTISYRLARIKEIGNLNLDSPYQNLNYLRSCLILKYLYHHQKQK